MPIRLRHEVVAIGVLGVRSEGHARVLEGLITGVEPLKEVARTDDAKTETPD